jgi:hypothetical protein
MESFEFFTAGGCGCGIVNVPDDATLARMFMEYPFGPFSDTELHPIIDGDTALADFRAMLSQMGSEQR